MSSEYDWWSYKSNTKFTYQDTGKSNMVNLGNTCYINSSIALLSNCLGLTNYFITNSFVKHINRTSNQYPFLLCWLKTITALFEENQTIKPSTMIKHIQTYKPEFKAGRQHDAHECIILILDLLHNSLIHKIPSVPTENGIHKHLIKSNSVFNSHFKDKWSIITDLFFGQYIQKVKCCKCKLTSFSYHPFLGLSLPIPQSKAAYITIYDTLRVFFNTQVLDKKCEKCKTETQHKLKLRIIKLPVYLLIQFKRFDSDLTKKNDHIAFTDTLDLSDFTEVLSGTMTYNLNSVINAYNASLDSGHFLCINKLQDGNWYVIDDNSTTPIEKVSDVCSKYAYILSYEINEF
jgi:ubiquitin C-terminal hydrolase